MVTIYVSNGRETRRADEVEPEWLLPKSGYYVWVDLAEPDRRGSAHPRRAVRLPRAGHRGRAQGDPDPEGRELRRPPLPDPARHRLLGGAAPLRDARGRHLPGRAVPGHRARRLLAVGRAPAARSVRATTSCWPRGRRRCCTASSTRWSTTTGPRSTSSRRGSTRSRTTSSTGPSQDDVRADPRAQARRGVAAPRRHAAARRRRPAGAARVPADLGAAVVPLPRRLRSPGPARRRGERCSTTASRRCSTPTCRSRRIASTR